MPKKGNSRNRNYLRINKDGVFYLPVGQEKMGQPNVVEVELDGGKKVYHELFYGGTEDGKITYIGISEKTFPTGKVKHLDIVIDGESEQDQVSLQLFNQKGQLNDYIKSVVSWLPNVDYSKSYSLKPATKKNPKGYVYRTLYLNETSTGDMVERKYIMGKEGNVPQFTVKEGIDGSKTYDFEEQDKFLFEKLKEELARFQQEVGDTYTPAPTEEDAPKNISTKIKDSVTATKPVTTAEADDDLPF